MQGRNEDILQVLQKAPPRCTACIRGVRRLTVQAHGSRNGLCAGCAQWGMTADASLANGVPIASRQINVDAAFCPVATCEAPRCRFSACAPPYGRQYICSRRIFLRSPRRYVFFRSSQQATLWLHCAAFCPFFSSSCDIFYHFLLQLSMVTAILEVAIIENAIECRRIIKDRGCS